MNQGKALDEENPRRALGDSLDLVASRGPAVGTTQESKKPRFLWDTEQEHPNSLRDTNTNQAVVPTVATGRRQSLVPAWRCNF